MKSPVNSKTLTGIIAVVAIAAAVIIFTPSSQLTPPPPASDVGSAEIVVFKTATCGCCIKWVSHLRDNGFDVDVSNVESTFATRKRLGVPARLGSCHTAEVGEYWVEGHVPADLVQRLMTERPSDIHGISAPGMPLGSPGMEGPNPVEYDIIAYHTDGSTSVYATRQGRSAVN